MEIYSKFITIKDNSYIFYYKEFILQLLADKKNKVKKKLADYTWFQEMTIAEVEKLSLDLYHVQLMDFFKESCKKLFG